MESEITLRAYYRSVWQTALQDAKTFWTAHKVATTLPSTFISFLAWAIFKGIGSRQDIMYALLVSVLGFLVALGLTLLVSLVKAPKLLRDQSQSSIDSQASRLTSQSTEMALLRAEIVRVNQEWQKPKRTPAEEHRYQIAKGIVEQLDEDARSMLRHLLLHRKVVENIQMKIRPLPSGMTRDQALPILDVLEHTKPTPLVTKTEVPLFDSRRLESTWEVAPGLVEHLDTLLHPD